jgi:D-glycero-D-manno-heptose 1,7-bisphosphate phosphatase
VKNTSNKAVFFDRDGIVNRRIYCGYVTGIDEFILLDDFFPIFKVVRKHGYLTVIITNQQGVGKGLMTEADLNEIHEFMQRELEKKTGGKFDAIYSCTDLDSAQSFRRKPNPGMILEAAADLGINLAESWMIGDSISDVKAGKSAGTKTILTGDFRDVEEADVIVPDVRAALHIFEDKLR